MAQLRCLSATSPSLHHLPSLSAHLPLHPSRTSISSRAPSLQLIPLSASSAFPLKSAPFTIASPPFLGDGFAPSASSSAIEGDRFVEPWEGSSGSGGGDDGGGSYNGGGGGAGWDGEGSESGRERSGNVANAGLLGTFIRGWQDRVRTDPQFPFKVLMEEVVGVGACVLGDMASRPNFGLTELDLVFSTIVVGSILNFTLMYLLAPTSAASVGSSALPGLFSTCPPGHMFEVGPYTLLDRFGTFVYKGAIFAAVGFQAGLVGTYTSTFLLNLRKKLDPKFEVQNKPPPTILNAFTWAIHMGLSSNLRYQALNGLEFTLATILSPAAFKASVLASRALNNVLGGVSFVALARLTGSQKPQDEKASSPPTFRKNNLQSDEA